MNLHTLPIEVQRLAQLGDPEGLDSGTWQDYIGLGIRQEHILPLMSILENIDDFSCEDADDFTAFLPMHAWRALSILQAQEAIPILVSLLDRDDSVCDELISEDLPAALAKIGPEVYSSLYTLLMDKTHGRWARTDAAEALALLAKNYPEQRSNVINALTEALSEYQTSNPENNAILVELLMNLKAVEAAPIVEQAYHSGRVDQLFIGDWEDFQVSVGLLNERQTSPLHSQVSPGSFMDGFPSFSEPERITKEDSKTKKTRKMAEKSKKINRQRHKKKK
jgi:hypothetical protein